MHKNSQPFLGLFSHLNSARHNLVIELCRALKTNSIFQRLSSKLAHSFVAIELLTYFIMQKTIVIADESSQY